jgi:hypothetical protein
MTTSPPRASAMSLAAGALITFAGGVTGQIVQASTDVSDDLFRSPFTSGPFIALMAVLACAFALVFVGLAGLRAGGLGDTSRGWRIGLGVALGGAALFVVAHLASIPVRNQDVDDTGASLVGGLFGLATLLMGVGLTVAGRAAVQARLWQGWRRFTLLVSGMWALLLEGLVLTDVMALAIAVFGLLLLATAVAVLTQPAPAAPRAAVGRAGDVTSSIALR